MQIWVMLIFTFLLLSTFLLVYGGVRTTRKHRKSLVPPIEDVIRGKNWPLEVHDIVSDGYHITYHRIPGSGRPVLVMNGMLLSSAISVVNEKVDYLVKAGFDVWMGNYRGSMYGLRHDDQVLYSTKSRRFWDFTFEEMGRQDLRQGLEHMKEHTGGQKVVYVGFSMGTTMFWVLAASDPEYTESRVEAMVALAPVARPSHCTFLTDRMFAFLKFLWRRGFNQFAPYHEKVSFRSSWLCGKWVRKPCQYLLRMRYRKHQKGMNSGLDINSFVKLLEYYPAGVSLKIMIQYMQIAKSGIFRQYDYGREGNFKVYKKYSPPEYNLTAVNIPTYFVYSDHDELATTKDVEWLMDQLGRRPQVLLHHKINHFGHADYNFNVDVHNLLDIPVAELVSKISQSGGPIDIEEIK